MVKWLEPFWRIWAAESWRFLSLVCWYVKWFVSSSADSSVSARRIIHSSNASEFVWINYPRSISFQRQFRPAFKPSWALCAKTFPAPIMTRLSGCIRAASVSAKRLIRTTSSIPMLAWPTASCLYSKCHCRARAKSSTIRDGSKTW